MAFLSQWRGKKTYGGFRTELFEYSNHAAVVGFFLSAVSMRRKCKQTIDDDDAVVTTRREIRTSGSQ